MTEQEYIDSLPPMRRLDALVARKVMGYTKIQPPRYLTSAIDGIEALHPDPLGGNCWGWHCLANYSTCSGSAWGVVERLKTLGFSFCVWGSPEEVKVAFVKGDLPSVLDDLCHVEGYACTNCMAESICRAALRVFERKD